MGRVIKAVPLPVLFALMIAVPSVWADWVMNGAAICSATGDQHSPAIVSDGAGGAIVTWRDSRNGPYASDIYAQRVDASGAVQWTTDGVALCTAMRDEDIPTTIVSDGAGGAIVTWVGAPSYDVYVQRVDARGSVLWTTNGVALTTATRAHANPTIVSDGAGGAIVSWEDLRTGNSDIYAQRVNALGTVQWTSNGVALCTTTRTAASPTIVSDGAGGAIVTWMDQRSGHGTSHIYAQRVNASGAVQWTSNGIALCTATGTNWMPKITSDDAGGAIVMWTNFCNIYAQRVNASGAVLWTKNGVAVCNATGNQIEPTIVSDGARGAIVTWMDKRSLSNFDIYAQRVNASGAVQWTADGVALCTLMPHQVAPVPISDGAGGAIVTWRDQRTANTHIYAQRVDASGAVLWMKNGVALGTTARAGHINSTIVADAAGGAIVVWEDKRSGTKWKIYGVRVRPNGSCAVDRN